MSWARDLIYMLVLILTSPLWILRLVSSGKWRTDWAGRLGSCPVRPASGATRTLLIHAVSVGEVNAIRHLVEQLQATGQALRLVISTTTNTGTARAKELYGQDHEVVRYPFDFSWAVGRFLRSIQPDAIALVELEVWPNFVAVARRRSIPVTVINGRLSERSFSRYRLIRPLIQGAFAGLAAASVQDDAYRDRFVAMGTAPDRVSVDGTMKWDTADLTDSVAGADALARAMGIDRDKPLVVCGSTGPGEEQMLAQALADADVQVMMVPRKPERFDEAAAALKDPVRRSRWGVDAARPLDETKWFLLDTMGELRAAYSLADVVIVGRSFCPLYGSDMMEPIALGKPTIIGPNTADFADTMFQLLAGDGIVQLPSTETLAAEVGRLLGADFGQPLADRGRQVIRAQQGSTGRIVERLKPYLLKAD
jgi:3-deoxy-D-manno-octulosonic-acid transferase